MIVAASHVIVLAEAISTLERSLGALRQPRDDKHVGDA